MGAIRKIALLRMLTSFRNTEDTVSKLLWNVDIHVPDYIITLPRALRSTSSWLCNVWC